MRLVVAAIFISTSLMMFFINGIAKNFASYLFENYEYSWLHSVVPWIPWLTLIIGLYYFFSDLYQDEGGNSKNNEEQ